MVPWKVLFCTVVIISLVREQEGRSLVHDGILGKQKDIIHLLRQVNSPAACFNYNILKGKDVTPVEIEIAPEEIFSVFNRDHMADAVKLYKSFDSANNYDEFYNIAVWARQNVNPGLFVYAFSAAVLHNPLMNDVVLPAFYEINPHYFISGSVIEKANAAEQNHTIIEVDVSADDIKYFTEDVGINSYYHYVNLLIPFWRDNTHFPRSSSNELYYLHLIQQLWARYNLERYSLGLNGTSSFDYEHPIKLGYNSDLVYPSGEPFPSRKDFSEITHTDTLDFEMTLDGNANAYTYIKDGERKLRDFIDSMKPIDNINWHYNYVPEAYYTKQKNMENDFVNLMGLNSKTDNSSVFHYARVVLGNPTRTQKTPSALEHFETSLRDPMFWPMIKRMIYFYNKYENKKFLIEKDNCRHNDCRKNYKYDDIEIINVEIDDLQTYFEDFKVDLVNRVTKETCEYLDVQANIKRLNHKPFHYSITLRSPHKSIFVKVFIGPKYDDNGEKVSLRRNRFNFVEIDRFYYNIPPHITIPYETMRHNSLEMTPYEIEIMRHSNENNLFSNDRTSFSEFYKSVIDGFIKAEEYKVTQSSKYYGFPKRFLLPKGSPNGTEFQLYVIALPTASSSKEDVFSNEYDFNAPFNNPIESDDEILGSNAFLKDITIYHND